MENPTGGQARYSGSVISNLTRSAFQPYRKSMQIIFQDPMSSLNPRFAIATALTEQMKIHGIGRNQDEGLELAAKLLVLVCLKEDHLVVEYLADRTIVTKDRKTVEAGDADQVCNHSTHPDTQKFLEALPQLVL